MIFTPAEKVFEWQRPKLRATWNEEYIAALELLLEAPIPLHEKFYRLQELRIAHREMLATLCPSRQDPAARTYLVVCRPTDEGEVYLAHSVPSDRTKVVLVQSKYRHISNRVVELRGLRVLKVLDDPRDFFKTLGVTNPS